MQPKISVGDKCAWIERAARDGRLTAFQFRLGVVIASHVDRFDTASATVSRDTLAKEIGKATLRGVEKATQALVRHGYLQVDRREIGTDGKGRIVHGGRGGCNIYRLTLETANGGSLLDEETANEGSLIERANGGSPLEQERANGGSTKSEPPFHKERTQVRTNLVLSKISPSGRSSGRRKNGDQPTADKALPSRDRLGELFDPIKAVVGDDQFAAWFHDVDAVRKADAVQLTAATEFQRQWIDQQFLGPIERALKVRATVGVRGAAA